MLVIPELMKQRQVDSWSSLSSRPSLQSELQAGERPRCHKNLKEEGGFCSRSDAYSLSPGLHIHGLPGTYIYTHIHTCTYKYIHIHTHIHSYTYMNMHTYTNNAKTHTRTCIHTHINAKYIYVHNEHVCMHTCLHTYIYTYTYTHISPHARAFIHIHAYTFTIHIHTCTLMHAHMRTHTCAYIIHVEHMLTKRNHRHDAGWFSVLCGIDLCYYWGCYHLSLGYSGVGHIFPPIKWSFTFLF